MNRRLIGLMLAVSFSTGAEALSLLAPDGEVVLGRPVRIAIPVAGEGVPADVSCFRLQAAQNPEYFPREGRLDLESGAGRPRLIVSTGSWPHPVLEFHIVARCGGVEIVREYVFLSVLPTAADKELRRLGSTRSKQAPSPVSEDVARRLEADTTLNMLARARYPDDRAARDEFRRQVAQLNPGMFPERGPIGSIPLAAGTRLKLPPETMPLPPVSLPRAAKLGRPVPPKASSGAGSRAAPVDRLVIGVDAFKGMSPREVTGQLERLGLISDEQARQFSEIEEKLGKLENTFAAMGKDFLLFQEQLRKIEAGRLQAEDDRERAEAERRKALAELAEARSRFGIWETLAIILAAGGVGAALIFYHDQVRMRRQRTLVGSPTSFPFAEASSPSSSPAAAPGLPVPAVAPRNEMRPVIVAPEEKPVAVEVVERPPVLDEPLEFHPPGSGLVEEPRPAFERVEKAELPHYDDVWNPAPTVELDTSAHDMAMELAEVMAAMGLKQGAAEALIEHIRTHPRETMSHWIKLLDIYHDADLAGQLAESVAELKGKFNVDFNEWEGRSSSAHQSLLEYQHLVTKLVQAWKTEDCEDFLIKLMLDTRDGTRQGFPRAVVEEIILLRAIAEAVRA